ncbi:MAG: hypothetical protein ACKO2P_20935 [Planctomycetota bacterium]
MKKAACMAILAGLLSFVQVGCGQPTYDIPEVDQAESQKNADDISKQMELQMKSGGQASPTGPLPGQITN